MGTKKRTYYMHTLNGKPASRNGLHNLYYTSVVFTRNMCTSLKQLRKQQSEILNHLNKKYPGGEYGHYDMSYVRVVVES
jgi:hypothetical protein